MVHKLNFVRYAFLILTLINSFIYINGFTMPTSYLNGVNSKKQNLKLRNNYNNLLCNEKYIYMKYLIGIRNFRKVYRIIKDSSNIDIQNIINIINNTQNVNIIDNNQLLINSSLFNNNNSLLINNTNINNDKIAKNLILSNIHIDVSNIKYIHAVHFQAWKQGLKTLYYCRSEKIGKADKISKKIERQVMEEIDLKALATEDICLACEG